MDNTEKDNTEKIILFVGEPQEYIAIPQIEYDRLKRIEAEHLIMLEEINKHASYSLQQLAMSNQLNHLSNQLKTCFQINTK